MIKWFVRISFKRKPIVDPKKAHLVLSGGLGHSPYVQEQLKSHYILGASHPNARSMQVRIAPDPQLAVCKGLVADRVCKLKAGKSILKWRRCRASYGTLCRELYDRNNPQHIGRVTVKDPMSGKMYVTQSVAWFIKKVSIFVHDLQATFINNWASGRARIWRSSHNTRVY